MIYIPRKNRVWYPGAIYHIYSRGNNKNKIFHEEADYKKFLYYLQLIKEQYPFHVLSFCLMSNHIHIQIETIAHPTSQIMQHLLTLYSKYYNNKYNLVGHVFQGRYHAEIIENEAYLMQTSRYIHLNPVKAKIVEKPIDYPWSSYAIFMNQKNWDLVNELRILDCFSDNSRTQYKEYVERYISEKDISKELIKFEMLVEKE